MATKTNFNYGNQLINYHSQASNFARSKGIKVINCPLIFKPDMSNNPNRGLGALKLCADGQLFVQDTWNSAFCDKMAPQPGDLAVSGRAGFNAFLDSNLSELLDESGITTLVLAGFLTNCCVESTMRTAYEMGYNVIAITDCCATMGIEGHKAAILGTFNWFSEPVTLDQFKMKFDKGCEV